MQVPTLKFPYKDEPLELLTQGVFNRGVITLIDQSKLPPGSLKQADNTMLYEDGAPGPRWGTDWYGTSPTLPAPSSAPVLTAATGTSLGIGTYQYLITNVSINGETTAGTISSITLVSGSQDVNLSAIPTGISGTLKRNIYRTKNDGTIFYLLTTLSDNTTTTYSDTTADTVLGTQEPPTVNEATSPIDGSTFFTTTTGANHLIIVAGGTLYRSIDDGETWAPCSGGSFTIGRKCYFEQDGNSQTQTSFLYIVDGKDMLLRYNGTTTLEAYSLLNSPTLTGAPVATSGIAGSNYTYYFRVAAINSIGFTASTTSSAGAVNVKINRSNWNVSNSQTNYVTVSWNAVAGALRYDIFVGDISGQESYIASVAASPSDTTVGYNDYGATPEQSNILAPTANTTTGPTLNTITLVGDRLWGTNDPNNPYRVWWSGSGPYMGYFSTSYDGGYTDLQYGSQYFPVKVESYQDGHGDPMTSVWYRSSDGLGCIWQISLGTATVQGLYTYTVPNAYQLPASRGTPAPMSVVNVLNDFMYYNDQGIYNLGPRAQYLDLLNTEESSVNIRPSVLQINYEHADLSCSHFFLDKVFFSVPVGQHQTVNNQTIVWDMEYKAWVPTCFTYGVERFLNYADNQAISKLHLLMWKPGDSQLSEISQDFQGDYGQPFEITIATGLLPVNPRNRFAFMFTQEIDVELSNPQGLINIALTGIELEHGFTTIATTYIESQTQALNVGWSSTFWSSQGWSYGETNLQVYTEPSVHGWKPVVDEICSYQFIITANTLPCKFILRTLQLTGSMIQASYPQQWRMP